MVFNPGKSKKKKNFEWNFQILVTASIIYITLTSVPVEGCHRRVGKNRVQVLLTASTLDFTSVGCMNHESGEITN